MLICDPRRIVSNVDRMAYEHLLAAGILHANKAGRPRVEKKLPKSRVGWKKLNPTGWFPKGNICDQCGKNKGHEGKMHPYGMCLCGDCLKVHFVSVTAGLKPTDDISW